MKYAFGLIFFSFAIQAHASDLMILRGRVPASYHMEKSQNSTDFVIVGNAPEEQKLLDIKIKRSKMRILVTVTHH